MFWQRHHVYVILPSCYYCNTDNFCKNCHLIWQQKFQLYSGSESIKIFLISEPHNFICNRESIVPLMLTNLKLTRLFCGWCRWQNNLISEIFHYEITKRWIQIPAYQIKNYSKEFFNNMSVKKKCFICLMLLFQSIIDFPRVNEDYWFI